MKKQLMTRIMAAILVVNTALLGFPGATAAGSVSTHTLMQLEARQAKVDRLQQAMLRDDVRTALVTLGVAPQAAQQRIATLSDQELVELEGQIDTLPAGGSSLLAVIGIVFVVLLILDLTGVTNVFTRIGK